jgi:cytoskeletal protein CcmA (bactofilin family)
MWKPSQNESPNSTPVPEPVRPAPPSSALESASRPGASAGDQATISKGLFIKGEITGSESLFIDGKVEGSINLNGNRVTVGRNGQVAASITAREVVVLGKVRGNVTASDRVDIRAEGALTGDVAAARISIEDGAFSRAASTSASPTASRVWRLPPHPKSPGLSTPNWVERAPGQEPRCSPGLLRLIRFAVRC